MQTGRSRPSHCAVYRRTSPATRREYRNGMLAAGQRLGVVVPTLWWEPVAGPSSGELARQRRAREMGRDLVCPLRVVVSHHTDGIDDLIVTADPAVLDRAGLDVVAEELGATAAACVMGEPKSGGSRHVLPEDLSPRLSTANLAVAIAAAHMPDCDDDAVTVEVVGAGPRPRFLTVGPATTVDSVRTGSVWRPDEPDRVHLRLTVDRRSPARGQVDYRPAQPAEPPAAVYVSLGSGTFVLDRSSGTFAPHFGAHVAAVAAALADGPSDRALGDVDWLDDAGRRAVIALGATPRTDPAKPRCLPDLVRDAMLVAPEAIALVDGDATVSYHDLVTRSTTLAHALRACGVTTGDRVGVHLARSADLAVVLLAVLTAGATYVPLDPGYPAARLEFLVGDANARLVVTDAGSWFGTATAIELPRLVEIAQGMPATPPDTDVTPDQPAYVIYTSGSTGKPKGVIVPHANVVRLLSATRTGFGFSPTDTWTWFHSVAFDFSVWEIWGCLTTGGKLVVVPRWVSRSPEDFHRLLVESRVTVLNQTPSAFAQLLDVDRRMPDELMVRLVIFGGERLPVGMLLPWFDRYPESRCRLVNMFGITETTVHVTWLTVTRAVALARSRSVGRAIPGWSVRIVDQRRRPLPVARVGEIAVGGDGLAFGYLGRSDLTEARFVIDADGSRLYLSGDKGRLLPDGQLEHLGRLDDQVSVRGHRVEPDEIRSVLLDDPSVTAAAVVFSQSDPDDAATARLDAYVVLSQGTTDDVRRRACRQLPDYMIPNTVTGVPALPLTENGKLDTSRLPAPHVAAPAVVIVPRNGAAALETVLDVWRAVFDNDVGPSDDFFTLGGNSLIAVRIASALRDNGLHADVGSIYRAPSPAALAAELELRAPSA